MDGTIVVNDAPTISCYNHALYMSQDNNGNLDINGGHIISSGRTAIRTEGNGATTIDNAEVLSPTVSKNAIINEIRTSLGSLTINSNSVISNNVEGATNQAIRWKGVGSITIKGNTEVARRRKYRWWRHS